MVFHNSAGWWSSNAVDFNWCGAQFKSQLGNCLIQRLFIIFLSSSTQMLAECIN